MKVWKLFK